MNEKEGEEKREIIEKKNEGAAQWRWQNKTKYSQITIKC